MQEMRVVNVKDNETVNPFKDKVRLYIELGENERACAHTYVALSYYDPNSLLESHHSHGIPIPLMDPNKIIVIMIVTIIMVLVIIQVRINNNYNNDNKFNYNNYYYYYKLYTVFRLRKKYFL